jgi:hypothetical protein
VTAARQSFDSDCSSRLGNRKPAASKHLRSMFVEYAGAISGNFHRRRGAKPGGASHLESRNSERRNENLMVPFALDFGKVWRDTGGMRWIIAPLQASSLQAR